MVGVDLGRRLDTVHFVQRVVAGVPFFGDDDVEPDRWEAFGEIGLQPSASFQVGDSECVVVNGDG